MHGAGCQRSDPKSGDPANYPNAGNGPQGDVQRVFNHVRLVRDMTGSVDYDGDGMSNDDEAFVGSDPEDANSILKLFVEHPSEGMVEVSWPLFKPVNQMRYTLYSRTNLASGSWIFAGSTTSSNLTRSVTSDAIFYKLEISTND